MLCAVLHSASLQTVTQECALCHRNSMDWHLVQTLAIRALNDELRTRFRGGTVYFSDDLRELGPIVVAHACLTMIDETKFDDDEHRTGHFEFLLRRFRWSISYCGSRNPAKPRITKRELDLWF